MFPKLSALFLTFSVCGCNFSNEPTSKPDNHLFLNLYSGMNESDVKDSLESFRNYHKLVKQEGDKEHNKNYLYTMNIDTEGGYLFSVEPNYQNKILYEVRLRYKGSFDRLFYNGQELLGQHIAGQSDLGGEGSVYNLDNATVKNSIELLSKKYGPPNNTTYKNQVEWFKTGVKINLSFYVSTNGQGNELDISYIDLSRLAIKNAETDSLNLYENNTKQSRNNETLNDL